MYEGPMAEPRVSGIEGGGGRWWGGESGGGKLETTVF